MLCTYAKLAVNKLELVQSIQVYVWCLQSPRGHSVLASCLFRDLAIVGFSQIMQCKALYNPQNLWLGGWSLASPLCCLRLWEEEQGNYLLTVSESHLADISTKRQDSINIVKFSFGQQNDTVIINYYFEMHFYNSNYFCQVFVLFCFYCETLSLYIGYPTTQYVSQVDLELQESTYLCLLSTMIKGICYYTRLIAIIFKT